MNKSNNNPGYRPCPNPMGYTSSRSYDIRPSTTGVMFTSDRPALPTSQTVNQFNCITCGQQCDDILSLNKHCYAMHDILMPSNYGTRKATGARPTGAIRANTCGDCGKQYEYSYDLKLHQLISHSTSQSLNHNQNYGQVFDQKPNRQQQQQFTSPTHNYPTRSNTLQRTTNTSRPTGAKQPVLCNQVKHEVKRELIDITGDNEDLLCSGGVFRRPQAIQSAIQLRFKCNICNKQMDDSQLLALHVMQAHPNHTNDQPGQLTTGASGGDSRKTFECYECGESFTKKGLLYTHKLEAHAILVTQNKSIQLHEARPMPYKNGQPGGGQFKCTDCTRTFSNYHRFHTHKAAHKRTKAFEQRQNKRSLKDKPNTGNNCGQAFDDMDTLNIHNDEQDNSQYNDDYVMNAPNNYQGSAHESQLLALHEMQAHIKYTRDIPEPSRKRKKRSKHKKQHEPRHKFQINQEPFSRLEYELASIRRSQEDKASTCNVCGQTFDNKDKLNKHIHSEHNTHNYYHGSAQRSRQRQLGVHSDGKPLKCHFNACRRWFPYQYQLDRHMQVDH